MVWLKELDISSYLNKRNYDIRVSRNARWIDQKCAADVISIIADCIINYIDDTNTETFTSREIWFSKYSTENVQSVFKKTEVEDHSAKSEYDKFFQQPMKMFAYAGILTESKRGRENIFSLNNREILEYIATRERNALLFLNLYIEKVLTDSGIFAVFQDFFSNQSKVNFERMKDIFAEFTIANTAIGSRTSFGGKNISAGIVECNRIFIKVLNPLAYFRNSLGTVSGHLSKQIITYDLLMYNRDNFRDIYAEKPKAMSRKDYAVKAGIVVNHAYFSYLSAKAKKFLRKFNDVFRDGVSEVCDTRHNLDKATNIHHIFAESEFPEISYYYENLIALTPTQHYNYAHANANTRVVDKDFQHQCLIAKTSSIKDNILSSVVDIIYDFNKYQFVLETGLEDKSFVDVEKNDFDGILAKINLAFAG